MNRMNELYDRFCENTGLIMAGIAAWAGPKAEYRAVCMLLGWVLIVEGIVMVLSLGFIRLEFAIELEVQLHNLRNIISNELKKEKKE